MDRLAPSSNGSLRLPVGYKFCPTDEAFVGWYLKKKALSRTNDHVVPEFDVFQTEPNNLPSGEKAFMGTKFFFLNLQDRLFEDADNRNAGSGQWRTAGEVKDLVIKNNKLIGRRNKFIFWAEKGTQFVQTKWVMYEYRLFLPVTASNPSQMSSWAGYKIFLEKDKKNKREKLETSDSDFSEEEEFEDEEFDEEEDEDVEVEDVEPNKVNFADESGINTGPPSPSSS